MVTGLLKILSSSGIWAPGSFTLALSQQAHACGVWARHDVPNLTVRAGRQSTQVEFSNHVIQKFCSQTRKAPSVPQPRCLPTIHHARDREMHMTTMGAVSATANLPGQQMTRMSPGEAAASPAGTATQSPSNASQGVCGQAGGVTHSLLIRTSAGAANMIVDALRHLPDQRDALRPIGHGTEPGQHRFDAQHHRVRQSAMPHACVALRHTHTRGTAASRSARRRYPTSR